MDYEEIFSMSYWRVFGATLDEEHVAETMYAHFMARPEIAAKFARNDPRKPMDMLRLSVSIAAAYYFSRKPELLLARFATLHNHSHLGIEPHLYPYWLDSVLQAVQAHDPACDADVLEAWRRILTPAIEFMQSQFNA